MTTRTVTGPTGVATGRRSTRAQYRKLRGPSDFDAKTSLQTALRKSLSVNVEGGKLGDAHKKRLFKAADNLLLLNHSHDAETHFFGELAAFRPGALSALIRQEEDDVPVLPIMQRRPAEGHEYLIGLLYFMAVGNHVVVIESRVRSRSLGEYLTWFLGKDRAAVIDAGQITLAPEIEIKLADGEPVEQAQLRLDRARRDELKVSARSAPSDAGIKSDLVGRFRALSTRARDVLHGLGSTDADIDKILQQLPEGASLEVEVIVRARSMKKTEPLSPRLVNDLFDASDDDEVILTGPGGKTVGSIGRLYHEVRVTTVGDLLDRDDAERALAEAYKVFVDNGRIEPVG